MTTGTTTRDHFDKDPADIDKWGRDWSDRLDDGETIATSVWLVPTGVTHVAAGAGDSHTDTTTTVWLSEGNVGQVCRCVNRITTSQGLTLERSIYITIVNL